MSYYQPDNWCILHMKGNDPHYKVLAGWSGSYLTGDSWRMNSGIVKCIEEDDHWLFIGSSGSTYACHKDAYGLRVNNAHVYNRLKEKFGDKIELLEDRFNWNEMDWILT
jgi:hypothetical protein